MRPTPDKMRAFLAQLKKKMNLKSLVVTLAAIVVFTTTYLLVLPAFTLDQEEAAQQGGIDIAVEETTAEVDAEASEDSVTVEETAAPGEVKEETDVKDTDAGGDEGDNVEETVTPGEVKEENDVKATDAGDDKGDNAKAAKESKDSKNDEVKLLTSNKTLEARKAKGDDFTVTAEVGKSAKLPEDVNIVASELDRNTKDFDYEKYYKEVLKVLQEENSGITDIKMIKFYDISLESDMLEDSVEPEDTVNVKIAFDKGIKVSDADNVRIVHFAEQNNGKVKPEVLDSDANSVKTTVNADDQMTAASFETDGFSVYAVVEPGGGGDNARMAVNFYNGTTLIKTMYVKNADDDMAELKKIIFDPGTGEIPEGWSFLGWTEDSNYTATSTRKTIDAIRDDIKEITAADSITEGDVKNYYAAIYKVVDVTYLGDGGVALGTDAFLRTPSDPESFSYTVNMSYSADSTHNFEGWLVKEGGNNIDGWTSGKVYKNEDEITISGSVTFSVNAPEGQWLIFHENKGTYIAPQFVKSGENTVKPTKEMERTGYTFDKWYADEGCTTPFEFGNPITDRTHVYAGWIKNTEAPYMVICWTQNTNRTGYEVADSWVNEHGQVGQNIPYTFVDNGDEDYVTGVGEDSSGTNVYDNGHYMGFCLTEASKNQEVAITPEGDAVLNLYFDRIEYEFKFYLYRDGTQNNRYDYANNSGNGRALNDLVTWHSNQDAHPSVNGYTIQSETVGGRTYYYFTISAYYGEDISSKWPTYDKITGANGRQAVSFVMMVGTKLKPNPTSDGNGTVKGVITVMNENILGALNDADGNYVVIRFPDSYYNWRYHIWFETVEGEDYSDKNTYTYEGKTYYEETVLTVRSSNTTPRNQNEPKYTGFDYQLRLGQNNQGVWPASSTLTTLDDNGRKVGNYWTTGNNPTLYHLNYVYNRQKFKIEYFDGNYVGDTSSGETTIQNKAGQLLHESPEIPFGAVIADEYRNYIPEPPEAGYVFEGWYLDEGCTVPYPWDTMPLDGIIVYAKWHRIQYRAFLHPNAYIDDDPTKKDMTLDWGSDDQALNFRIDYLGTISLPFGTRSGYEFAGWFTESGAPYNEETKLTDDNTVAYNKAVDMTDVMDKWGEGATWNSDVQDQYGNPRNRFWITKKIDLYGRWRKEIPGAPGIRIIYELDGGTGNVEDETLYKDTAHAAAQSADITPPENKTFDHWVLQTWNNETGEYEDTSVVVFPGGDFEVLKNDSKVVVTEWKSAKDNTAVTSTDGTPAVYSGKDEITGPTGFPYISEATYTIQLKAVYLDKGNETPTHIDWYPNYGDNYAIHQDKNLQINQATSIYPAPTREGYKFLGWARVPTTQSQSHGEPVPQANVLNLTKDDVYLTPHDDGTWTFIDKDGETVRTAKGVAADEITPYHDMYAVWEKLYTVTVKKVVVGAGDDLTTKFTFTPTGVTPLDTFQLADTETKVYKDLSLGTTVSFTEAENPDFEISVEGSYKTTNEADEEVDVPIADLVNGSSIQIQGDTVITFTNTRKAKKIRFYKVDDSDPAVPLEGVGFTLAGQSVETGSNGYTDVIDVNASDDPYALTETPIDHYTGLSDGNTVTVGSTGISVQVADADTGKFSISGPDSDGVYTINVVNPRERYKVTVEKAVVGNSTDKTTEFSFTATGLTASADSFQLVDQGKKEYTEIPYGTVFSVAETPVQAFDTSIVVTKADNTTTNVTGTDTGNLTVDGNMTVKYTNTRNRQIVQVYKTDTQDGTALEGAQFTLNGSTITSGPDGYTGTVTLPVRETAYELEETVAPAGYAKLENPSTITVSADGVSYTQGTSGQPTQASINSNGAYQINITNTAGTPLPTTGGIGTTIFYVLGSLLVVGCGVVLVARRRMKSEEK